MTARGVSIRSLSLLLFATITVQLWQSFVKVSVVVVQQESAERKKTIVIGQESVERKKKILNQPHEQELCKQFFPNEELSPSMVWNRLKQRILNASYFPLEISSNNEFRSWVDDIFDFYTTAHLRDSVSHPADPAVIVQLLKIISDFRYRKTSEPLRIFVFGGSVVFGIGCGDNPVGLPVREISNFDCAWPKRLEHLLNNVFFEGQPAVEVVNLGAGGISHEIGKLLLEYRLLPKPVKLPHVVVSAYSPNEAQEQDKVAAYYEHVQGFVHAAQNLHRCDNNLPLIVMVNDFYKFSEGEMDSNSRIAGSLYKTASWYGLMGVDHDNVVRHKLLEEYKDETVQPLIGSFVTLHNGMGFHIGMAWTMLFNFLTAFVDTCNDIVAHDDESSAFFVSHPSKDKSHNISTTNNHWESHLHTKHLGSLTKTATFNSVLNEWKNNSEIAKQTCAKKENMESICTYAWIHNLNTDVRTKEDVERVLKDVLQFNQGWMALGNPIRQPRAGWYGQEANASFSLTVHPTIETKYVTIMYMKSYGPDFVDAKLNVTVQVAYNNLTLSEVGTHQLSGYQSARTSAHYPHKFELPGVAGSSDSILLKARLVSGAYWKINGLAFCAF